MRQFPSEAELIKCLDTTADAVIQTLGVEPIFIGECPNKFNDADHDDLWYAVQAGHVHWEQSHFFEYGELGSLVKEHASYPTHGDTTRRGAQVESEHIAFLRHRLHHLQESGWRTMSGWPSLIGLVIERGQKWFVLETPNGDTGEAYAWDNHGFFFVGTFDRIDQEIGERQLLHFNTVSREHLQRLSTPARRYFFPKAQEERSLRKLADLLWNVTQEIRRACTDPVALRSRTSRPESSGGASWHSDRWFPEIHCPSLRPGEGEFRVPKDGKWPLYQGGSRWPREKSSEYSKMAKALHLCLGALDDAKWRTLFGEAFGEKLDAGQSLTLFVNPDISVLMRENAAFEVSPRGLSFMGQYDYPDCRQPEVTISHLSERSR